MSQTFRRRSLPSILAIVARAGLLHSNAEAAIITYDAGSGIPPSYTEGGFTWTSIYPGAGHLHLGDNDADSSPDLFNHTGCCSAPFASPFQVVYSR